MRTVAPGPGTSSARPPCASAIARTIERPRPGAVAGAGEIVAGEALEGALGELGGEALALVDDLELQPASCAAGPQDDLALAVAQRVVDEVAERLAQAQLVGVHGLLAPASTEMPRPRSSRGRRSGAPPARAGRAGRAARAAPAARPRWSARGSAGPRPAARGGRIPRPTRPAPRAPGIVSAGAQRSLELGLDDRDRGAQLVAGVGDEAALALEGAAEAIEHLVQRLAEPADLVAGGGQREPLVRAAQRDLLARAGASPRRAAARRRRARSRARRRPGWRSGPPRAKERTRLSSASSRSWSDWPTATTSGAAAGRRQHARRPLDARDGALHEDPLAAPRRAAARPR